MSGSKTLRKQTNSNGGKCKYVFKKGDKEGETCGRNCRGDFCKDHNAHRQTYSKKYYTKKNNIASKKNYKDKIRKLKRMTVNKLRPMIYYQLRLKKIEEEMKLFVKTMLGLGLFLKPKMYQPKIDDALKRRDEIGRNLSPVYKEFTGTKEQAEKKFTKMTEDKEVLVKRYKKYKEICEIVEQKYATYFEENKEYPKNYYS